MKGKRILTILFLFLIILFLVKKTDETLENPERLSGVSFASQEGDTESEADTIDCYYNVENYSYSLNRQKKKNCFMLKNCLYSFLDDLNIPGMPSTRLDDLENNRIFSEAQCPQGMCFSDKYIFFSSYSSEKDCLGEILVFSRDTEEYLFTLGMNSSSHLGGIAFDGENIWACNSNSNCLERISYDFVCLMAEENTGKLIDASGMVDIYQVENSPSCITWYNNRLWIATHATLLNSKMKTYYYDPEADQLVCLSTYAIPPRVQGIAFNANGKVYLSTSYGRTSSSWLRIYSDISEMSSSPENPLQEIEMPPCSEEIVMDDNDLYLLFESAGEKYYDGTDGAGKSLAPIDKVLVLFLNEEGLVNVK